MHERTLKAQNAMKGLQQRGMKVEELLSKKFFDVSYIQKMQRDQRVTDKGAAALQKFLIMLPSVW